MTVGGTSAGASILSEHMIAFGDEGSSVIAGGVRLAPGLGLTNRFVIDQHFRERDRLGRLMPARIQPLRDRHRPGRGHRGVHRPGRGAGSGGGARDRRRRLESELFLDQRVEGQAVAVLGLKVHVLVAGTTFDLNTRTASAASLVPTKE